MRLVFKSFAVLTAAVLAPVFALQAFAQETQPQNDFVRGELLLGFGSEKDREDAAAELKALEEQGGLTTRGGAASTQIEVDKLGESALKLKLSFVTTRGGTPDKQTELQLLRETAAALRDGDKRVRFAHPNWIVKLSPPTSFQKTQKIDLKNRKAQFEGKNANDIVYRYGLHWHYGRSAGGINAVDAWKRTRGDRKIVVAVLDSGILSRHPDLASSGNVLPGYDFLSDPKVAGDGDGRDANPEDVGDSCEGSPNTWHGSHVAGTVGAAASNNRIGMTGVNWQISVLPIRVLGRCGGNMGDIIEAMRWAAGLPVPGVPRNRYPADVLNLSLGGSIPCTPENMGLMLLTLEDIRRAGATVVVAAGNESIDVAGASPGGCPGVISVAAGDMRGHMTAYSNYGRVTLMAPGGASERDDDRDGFPDGIWSLTLPTRDNPEGVRPMDGTSMAAPHVAAAIALAIAHRPEWKGKPDLIEEALLGSLKPHRRGACAKPCGAGRLDAAALLDYQPGTRNPRRPRRDPQPPRRQPSPGPTPKPPVGDDLYASAIWNMGRAKVLLLSRRDERIFILTAHNRERSVRGVPEGFIIFQGRKDGDRYTGTAFIHSKRCGRQAYPASGPILEQGPSVLLEGDAPRINRKTCKVEGTRRARVLLQFGIKIRSLNKDERDMVKKESATSGPSLAPEQAEDDTKPGAATR